MPEILHQEPELLCADVEGVFVNLWGARKVQLRHIEALIEAQLAWAGEERRFGVLTLIDVDVASGIEDDAKQHSAAHTRRMASRVFGQAQVPMGGRLKAFAARQVMKAQNAFMASPSPVTIHGSVRDAARWMAGQSPTSLDASILTAQVETLWRER
jgi:hypothetical protein